MIAALFVESGGSYFGLTGVEPWDLSRDARKYAGPWPVVAHPPCERWGRYWSGGPSAKVRRIKGDDAHCFRHALRAVEQYGGVLEHPEASHAWAAFGIPRPPKTGGWIHVDGHAWTCCVEQGNYGHRARKATWLYCRAPAIHRHHGPPDLIWGPSSGVRLDEGFHSKSERAAARARGQRPIARLSRLENLTTPPLFRDLLIGLAKLGAADGR